ncbi:MAG: FtsQ-type POTRA domain-containing protein [Desulfobacterales bacterium]
MAKNRYRRIPKKRHLRALPLVRPLLLGLAGMVLLSAMSTVMIFTYDLFTQCDYFKARHLPVAGNQRLEAALVLKEAGLQPGTNILSVNLPMIRKRLLAHPWIAQAQVRRELPDTIVLTVSEHQPLAVIDLGKRFLVNQEGEIFKALQAEDPQTLPLVQGLNVADLALPEDRGDTIFDAVMTVLTLGSQPHSVLPNHQIQTIQVDREMGLSVEAFGQRRMIHIGFEDYPAKYQRLRQVINYINQASDFPDFRWIDLNNVDRIVVHPVSPKEA